MLEGLVIGSAFYCIALLYSLWGLDRYQFINAKNLSLVLLCWIGHYLGCCLYSTVPSDSFRYFFLGATPVFHGLGTGFVTNITWYVREFFTGDSYLATLLFFSAFAFLGSISWLLLLLQLGAMLKLNIKRYHYPVFIILCWPSFLLFTAGIGKDSLSFFLIPSILFAWNQLIYQRKNIIRAIIKLFFLGMIMTCIRPYLLMIMLGAIFFVSIQLRTQLTLMRLLAVLVASPLVVYGVYWVMTTQGGMGQGGSSSDIIGRAYHQQELLSTGTVFPMLSTNPVIVFFSLPYSFLMNLIMPLFIFAHSFGAYMASFENLFLVSILIDFFKKRKAWEIIKIQCEPVRLIFYVFMMGMALLGLLNTNLGLATRQKGMFLPGFLVVAMLVRIYFKEHYYQARSVVSGMSVPQTM